MIDDHVGRDRRAVEQVSAQGIGDGRCDGGGTRAQHGLADASPAALAADSEVIARIAAGVAEGNTKLARVEQIKRFRVLPALWEPGGDEITLTTKLKRRPIAEKYAAEIEELYASEPGPDVHEPKTAQIAPPA